VRVVTSTVATRESQKRHRCHAGGTQNNAEYVEVHLSTRGSQRVFTSAKCWCKNPRTNYSYGDSVLHVSVAQLQSRLGVNFDTQPAAKPWHASAAGAAYFEPTNYFELLT